MKYFHTDTKNCSLLIWDSDLMGESSLALQRRQETHFPCSLTWSCFFKPVLKPWATYQNPKGAKPQHAHCVACSLWAPCLILPGIPLSEHVCAPASCLSPIFLCRLLLCLELIASPYISPGLPYFLFSKRLCLLWVSSVSTLQNNPAWARAVTRARFWTLSLLLVPVLLRWIYVLTQHLDPAQKGMWWNAISLEALFS